MNQFVKSNTNLCIGCRTCMIACVVAHEGKHIYEIDPNGYDFNPRLTMTKTVTLTSTVQCHHCENAPCVKVCPVDALYFDKDRIGLDQEICIGCKQCNHACPFGAIRMVDMTVSEDRTVKKTVAHKCDLCTGLGHGPACVSVCPTGALTLENGQSIDDMVTSKRNYAAATVNVGCKKEGA